LRILRVRQRIIIGTALVVIAITAIIVFRMTPLYDASAFVMLDQRQNKVVDVNAVLSGLPTDAGSIENQIQILRSRSLMSRVIDKLHLDQGPGVAPRMSGATPAAAGLSAGFNPSALLSRALYYADPQHWFPLPVDDRTADTMAQQHREGIINGLLGSLSVTEIGHSSAMKITFRSPDPARSATIANAIADAYVEDQLNAKFEATQKTSQWLADRLQQLSRQVQEADAAVQEYKAENDITDTQGGGTIVDQQLAAINGQLVAARSVYAEAQARYTRVRQLRAQGRIDDVSQVVQSGLIGDLVAQETSLLRQQADLSTKYGPRHPKMLEVAAQLRNLKARISQVVERVVGTVANDVAIARAHVASLQSSLKQVESQNRVESKAEIKLSELRARAASTHQLYEAFLGKFKETQGQEGIEAPDARVISRAIVPGAPVEPNITRALELAVAGGLFLGFALAMLMERLDAGFRTVAQVERTLGVPVLSTLPELAGLGKSRKPAADRVVDRPLSAFAEAVRGLQMGLVLSNVDHRPKVVVVTSSVPYEGKTTVALSLARVAARGEQRVMLIDGDLRRPSLSKALPPLAKSEKRRGLIDVLAGQANLEECLIADSRSSVMILPTTRVVGNPPDLLGSAAMDRLVDGLRGACDLIVIDSAPMLAVNDTKVLARLADAVLFVVRWEKTPREAVVHGARALADVGAHVAGVVLTRAHSKRYRYYSYGYQNNYYYSKYYND
jgi:exopolysaccharide transport family protein